jgi:hypothetical protein
MILPLLLLSSVLTFGTAIAGPSSPTVARIAKLAMAQTVIPQEWDGIWTTEDSLYLCDGTFQNSPASTPDTICGGQDYQQSGPVTLTCSGTATATTIDQTCTGSGTFIPDCDANYTVVTHGTRSADSYFLVTTVSAEYVGAGCAGIPPSCSQINIHGTRIGPAPAEFCATTPTKRRTWGEIKAIYR